MSGAGLWVCGTATGSGSVGFGGRAGLSNPRSLLGKGPLNRGAKFVEGLSALRDLARKGEIRQLRTD